MNKKEIIKIKKDIIIEVIKRLEKSINNLKDQYKEAKKSAIEAPSKMESHSDPLKDEFNALADSLQKIIDVTERGIRELNGAFMDDSNSKLIKIGSLVEIKKGDVIHFYFILPAGGGEIIKDVLDNNEVVIVTPETPLAKEIIGKKTGHKFVVAGKNCVLVNIL